MSLEDQYDAWVRSVTGTGRHSATKQDRDAAQNSLNAMQAQLDALAESQKRQKSAADALNTVQRAGAATADSVRRMSSELTQSLRQDGLLGGKTAQPAPAAEPVKAGPENFNGLADRVRQQVLGQDAFVGQVVKAGGGRRWQSMGFPLRFLHYLCVFYASLAFGSFVDFFCV